MCCKIRAGEPFREIRLTFGVDFHITLRLNKKAISACEHCISICYGSMASNHVQIKIPAFHFFYRKLSEDHNIDLSYICKMKHLALSVLQIRGALCICKQNAISVSEGVEYFRKKKLEIFF